MRVVPIKFLPSTDSTITCVFCQLDDCDLEATYLVERRGNRSRVSVGAHTDCVILLERSQSK